MSGASYQGVWGVFGRAFNGSSNETIGGHVRLWRLDKLLIFLKLVFAASGASDQGICVGCPVMRLVMAIPMTASTAMSPSTSAAGEHHLPMAAALLALFVNRHNLSRQQLYVTAQISRKVESPYRGGGCVIIVSAASGVSDQGAWGVFGRVFSWWFQ